MLFHFEADKVYTIKDIQKYTKEHSVKMLSEFGADFWGPYRNNYQYFDRLFMKRFASWFPIDQEYDEGIESIQQDFTFDVYAHLLANEKRYSELYRIQTIVDDEKYSLTDNVYETESISKSTSNSGTFNKGAETITDSGSTAYGKQTDTERKSAVHPSYTDSESKSLAYGQQLVEVDGTVNQGVGGKTVENSTSAYNSSAYTPTDRTVETTDSQTETTNMDTTHGAHTDTETNSYTNGAHTDTETNTYERDAHTDTTGNTRTDSARADSSSETGTEAITRERVGNIGVKDVDEILMDHNEFWGDFSFYYMIFDEIAMNLLRGC